MKSFISIAPILVAATGCSTPVVSAQEVNGCYFAAGPEWVFKIFNGHLEDRGGQILSTVTLTKPSRVDSVVMLTPGIRLTETPQKSMVVVQGDTQKLMASRRRNGVQLTLWDVVGRTDFHQRRCV